MQTDSYNKRDKVLFVFAIGSWLLAFAAAHALSPFVVELHRAKGVTPFSVRMWWQLLPWLAIIGLSVDYWLVLRSKARRMHTKRQVLKYYIFLSMAFFFVVLSCWPMIVLLP
jgi:hypothetical protein